MPFFSSILSTTTNITLGWKLRFSVPVMSQFTCIWRATKWHHRQSRQSCIHCYLIAYYLAIYECKSIIVVLSSSPRKKPKSLNIGAYGHIVIRYNINYPNQLQLFSCDYNDMMVIVMMMAEEKKYDRCAWKHYIRQWSSHAFFRAV